MIEAPYDAVYPAEDETSKAVEDNCELHSKTRPLLLVECLHDLLPWLVILVVHPALLCIL